MQGHHGAAGTVAGRRHSAVRRGDGLDEREPQSGTPVTARPAGVWAPEPLERIRQETVRKARPGITDLDVKSGAVGDRREHDRGSPRGEAQRVIDQVVDGLADPVRIDIGKCPGPDVDTAGDPGRGQAGTGQPGAAREHLPRCPSAPAAG